MDDEIQLKILAELKAIHRALLGRAPAPNISRPRDDLTRLAWGIFNVVGERCFAVAELLVFSKVHGRLGFELERIAPLDDPSAARRIGHALLQASKLSSLEGLEVHRTGKRNGSVLWRIVDLNS